jgi:FkbM family methyltransferase
MVRDFLGTRTVYTYDCENARYRPNHLERQIPCNEHDALAACATPSYAGPFPVASEEYLEWIDLLRAVQDAAMLNQPLVMMELGARYGTWMVRGAAAYVTLTGRRDYTVVGVEGDKIGYEWMQQHVHENGIEKPVLWHRAMGERDGQTVDMSWEGASHRVETISLPTLLAPHYRVHLVDMDIQGAELAVCQAAGSIAALNQKVRRVHIGTHSVAVHKALAALFITNGWAVDQSYEGRHNSDLWNPSQFTQVPIVGRVHFNDGVLSVRNKRFD